MRGLGLTGDLVAAEAGSWRRFLPGTLPWTELHRFEREVERLEARRRKLQAEAEELNARLRDAPSQDTQALADWERGGRRGPQPESIPRLGGQREQPDVVAARAGSRALQSATSPPWRAR